MALNKQNMRADCPKDKLEFKIFFKHCIGSIFHLFPMKENGGHAHNIAKENPLPQVVIDRAAQETVSFSTTFTHHASGNHLYTWVKRQSGVTFLV